MRFFFSTLQPTLTRPRGVERRRALLEENRGKPVERLEYAVVEHVKMQIEATGSREWAKLFKLKPVFKAVLES